MMKIRSIPAFLLLAAQAAVLLASCVPDSGQWFPSGKAEIVNFCEKEDRETKSATATIRIANTGQAVIRSITVSASLGTESRRYYRTVTDARAILPGGLIFIDVEFIYDSASEKAEEGGARLESSFYE